MLKYNEHLDDFDNRPMLHSWRKSSQLERKFQMIDSHKKTIVLWKQTFHTCWMKNRWLKYHIQILWRWWSIYPKFYGENQQTRDCSRYLVNKCNFQSIWIFQSRRLASNISSFWRSSNYSDLVINSIFIVRFRFKK